MKYTLRIAKASMALLLGYFILTAWFASSWSERYWSWLNEAFGGQQLGLASDVEFVTALIAAFGLSFGFIYLGSLCVSSLRRRQH